MNAAIFTDTKEGSKPIGSQWGMGVGGCTTDVPQHQLQPGASIDLVTVLYPPVEPVNGELYVKVIFQRGTSGSDYSYNPIEIKVPLKALFKK